GPDPVADVDVLDGVQPEDRDHERPGRAGGGRADGPARHGTGRFANASRTRAPRSGPSVAVTPGAPPRRRREAGRPRVLDRGGPALQRAHEVAERAGETEHAEDDEQLPGRLDGRNTSRARPRRALRRRVP